MSESFAELLEESFSNINMKPGTIVDGTVIDVKSDVVVVNAGLKSEGVIPIEQFKNERGEINVAPGDVVEVRDRSKQMAVLLEAARWALRFVQLPIVLEVAVGMILAGCVLVLASFVMERNQDRKREGDLLE